MSSVDIPVSPATYPGGLDRIISFRANPIDVYWILWIRDRRSDVPGSSGLDVAMTADLHTPLSWKVHVAV